MSGRVDAWWLPRSGARVLAVTIGAAALATIATVSAWPRLAATPQPYSDLVAGMITWSDYPKSSEYVAAAWFFAAFVLAWPILSRLANQLPWPERGALMIDTPAVPHALYLGIATYAAAFGLLTRSWPWFPLIAALVLPAAWAGLTRGSTVIPAIVPACPAFVALLVAVVCAYFSLLGMLAAMDTVIPTWFAGHTSLWSAFALITPFIFACGLVLGHRRFSPATWRTIVSGSQIPLPVLITVLAHDAYLHDGLVTRLNMPTMTKAGVLVFAAAMCAREMIAWRRAEPWLMVPDADRLIRPSSVVWIAAFLAYRVPEFSGFEWDSLHLGELLLPWHQAVTHHRALFDQFVPAQGGMSLLYGAVNTLALDGTVASFPIAVSWLSVAAAAGAAWTVCRLVGPGWALLLAPFLPIGYTSVLASFNRFFLALPILAVLAHPTLLARPRRWLMMWAGLSMVHVLYNAIVGLACTAATAPVAAWMAVRARTTQAEIAPSMITPRRTAMMFAIGGLGAALAPSLGAYLLGLARFVIENAPTNTTAFGVGVMQAGRVPDWFWWHDHKLAWELIRIGGWVGGAIALAALAVHQVSRQRRGDPAEPAGVVITLTGALCLLALIPYSLGQVWPDELSRSGAASMLAVGGLLPLASILTCRRDPRAALIAAGVIGALLGVRGAFGDPNPWQIAQRAIAAIDAPARTAQRSGAAAGVPNAGEGFVLPDKLDAIRRLNEALRRLLRGGETYLDLTNRPALYFVLDRPVPAPYPDDYNAPNGIIQRRVIDALQRDPPPVAWIGPREGNPASLRAYRLYRWLLERGYRFHEANGYQFLVRADRADHLGLGAESDHDRAALRRIFAPTDLGRLPQAWGRALGNHESRFRPLPASLAAGPIGPALRTEDPTRVWRLNTPIRGRDADFAAIRVSCSRALSDPIIAQVLWSSDAEAWTPEHSLTFRLAAGELLLPMGAHPDWLRGEGIAHLAVRVDRATVSRCGTVRVGPPRLLRLTD